MQIHARSFYRAPAQTKSPYFASYDYHTKKEHKAKSATRDIFQNLFRAGLLDPNKITSICDFGFGEGQPTEVMKELFPKALGSIIAVDIDDTACKVFSQIKKILPPENVICDDGINYLNQTEKRFDLITNFCLRPNNEKFIAGFLNAAKTKLKPGGKVLICTNGNFQDSKTNYPGALGALYTPAMTLVGDICRRNNLKYHLLEKPAGEWEFMQAESNQVVVISNLTPDTEIR